jgi:Fic family protein
LAVEPQFVNEELSKLFNDITELLKRDLSYKEVFYYASMIHLWTAKIHPFMDGNGRSARLLEKWFFVSKLGLSAWSINSEKYYWDNRLTITKTLLWAIITMPYIGIDVFRFC